MLVVSVGEVLWDIIEDQAFLGGAPLNVCANLQRCGDEALLISAVGDDARGRQTLRAIEELHLSTRFLDTVPGLATGTAVVSRDARQEPHFVIQRPAAFDAVHLDATRRSQLAMLQPDWIYMGTLLQTDSTLQQSVDALRREIPAARCFYDMNLREGHWNLALVERLCQDVNVLKLNEVEAATLSSLHGVKAEDFTLESFCSDWAQRFSIDVICVTLGPQGCGVHSGAGFERFPGRQVTVSDTVGAGDAFTAAFLHGFQQGWPIARCAGFANSLGALVASRRGATPAWTLEELSANWISYSL